VLVSVAPKYWKNAPDAIREVILLQRMQGLSGNPSNLSVLLRVLIIFPCGWRKVGRTFAEMEDLLVLLPSARVDHPNLFHDGYDNKMYPKISGCMGPSKLHLGWNAGTGGRYL